MKYSDFHEWHRDKIKNPSGTDGQRRVRIYFQPTMAVAHPFDRGYSTEQARVVIAHLKDYGATNRQISLLTVQRSCWTLHPCNVRIDGRGFLSGERSRFNKTIRRIIYDTPYRIEL